MRVMPALTMIQQMVSTLRASYLARILPAKNMQMAMLRYSAEM